MKYLALCLLLVLISCNKNILPTTLGASENAVSYGYQPIDPLPINIRVDTGESQLVLLTNKIKTKITNSTILASLPDETIRIAIGEIDMKSNISFTTSKLGIKGKKYIVILDYAKFNTQSLPIISEKNDQNEIISIKETFSNRDIANAIVPIYLGVGLRMTASITVNEGKIDLGNLLAIGIAAEAKKVTGTLVLQTLGISGKEITSIIPMPSQINSTTIQNAIMALATIKSKIYNEEIDINPRIIGFYNNIGGGEKTVLMFLNSVLAKGIWHDIL